MAFHLDKWWILLSIYGFIEGSSSKTCLLDSSEFVETVNSPCFIDKTLLIKEVFYGPKKVFVSAPPRFRKSTNLNMLKRFLEISVNEIGIPKEGPDSSNYELFATRNLEIFQLKEVFIKHFGQYPVLHIDYTPMEEVTNFESMLEILRRILLNTFEEHLYLIENQTLWSDISKEQFIRYIHPTYHLTLSTASIRSGFKHLLHLLFTHFNKKVFILVDGYNSHLDGLLYQNNPDIDIIVSFIQSINKELFNFEDYVERIFITGRLRTLESSTDLGIADHYFLGDHPFSTFNGLSSRYLSKILVQFSKSNDHYSKLVSLVDKYFNGYLVLCSKIKLFSIYSLFNYLDTETKVNEIRCRKHNIRKFQSIINISNISDVFNQLLLEKKILLNIVKPFSDVDIFDLNKLMSSYKIANDNQIELFFVYLFQIGYISINDELTCSCNDKLIKIPNREVLQELKGLLLQNQWP